MPHNPGLYREMSAPFSSPEALGEAIKAFQDDIGELRKKHKIPDVLVIVSGDYVAASEEGGELEAMAIFSFGSAIKAPFMTAYAFGAERQAMEQNILSVAKQAMRRKHSE